jgi:hypothetical protein
MSNPILIGSALTTEFYRGYRLELYETDTGWAVRALDCLNRLQFITYSHDFAVAKSRIDDELEGTTDEIPF